MENNQTTSLTRFVTLRADTDTRKTHQPKHIELRGGGTAACRAKDIYIYIYTNIY